MRSRRIRTTLKLAAAGTLCVLLLAACSKLGSSISSALPTSVAGTGTGAATNACTLLTKAQVATATGHSIDFARQANVSPLATCTYASISGFAVVLSVTTSPTAGLSSDIPGLGNVVTKYHLTSISGVGDQAYAGPNAIIARKGNTAFVLVYATLSAGNHQPALTMLATEVASRL